MKQFLRSTLAAAVAVGLALPLSASALDKLTTEKEKISYMVGLDLANGVGQIKDEIDINIVVDAMKTQLAGGKLLMTAEESQAVRQSFMQKLQAAQQAKSAELAAKNKAEGDKFLADNKAKPGVKTTASGLQYSVVKEGTGKKPTAESTVKVHYTGTLLDGTKFDIVNTVFNNNKPMAPGTFSGIWVRNATATTPGRIVNSTFVRNESASTTRKALLLDCIPATGTIAIVNSLFLNSTPTSGNTYVHADCRSTAQKYLGSDDVTLTGDNNATDLVFSDVFNAPTFGDYSLTNATDSRVRDGGLTQFVDGGKNIVPTIDMIGTARTATKLSRGAFEAAR